jgi:hypothetical protein
MDKTIILVDLFRAIYGNKFTKKEINHIRQFSNENTVFFYLLGERFSVDDVNKVLKIFFDDFSDKNTFLICDRLFTDEDISKFIINNVIVVDSQLIKVAQHEERNQFNNKINLDSNKFLFLMGKPYKQNRLPFLYELYKNDLLKYCDYSFYYSSGYFDKTRKIMSFLSDDEYNQFIEKTQKTLDNINPGIAYDFFNYEGLPVDPNLYKNTAFSVVSESTFDKDNFHFISEKTWRTIANRHMFISMSPKNYKDYLNNLGIRTFDYCLKYKKEDFNLYDIEELNRMTAENVKFLLENIKIYKDKIKRDIEFNYIIYKKLVLNQRRNLDVKIENQLYITDYSGEYRHIKKLKINETVLSKIKNENTKN